MHCTADQLGNDSQTSCPDPRGRSALSLPAVPVTVVPWTMPVSSLFLMNRSSASLLVKQLFGTTVTWFWAAGSLKTDKLVHRLKQSQLNQRRDYLESLSRGHRPPGVQLVNRIATPEQRQEFLDQADFLPESNLILAPFLIWK